MLRAKNSRITTLSENHNAIIPLSEAQLAAVEGGNLFGHVAAHAAFEFGWEIGTALDEAFGISTWLADTACDLTACNEPDYTDYTAHGINLSSEYPDADPDELAAIGRSMVGRF